jgi:hypothetical protein
LFFQSGDNNNGGLKARRVKSFADVLAREPLLSSGTDEGLGATNLVFSADSSRFAIATFSGHIVIVNVSAGGNGADCEVARVFPPRSSSKTRRGGRAVIGERPKPNGHAHTNGDVEMAAAEEESSSEESEEDEDESKASEGEGWSGAGRMVDMAISSDGQWLAAANSEAGLHVYNLDSLQVCC